jgi:hypothetical protein
MAIVYIGRKLVHNGDKVGGEKILYLKLILLFLNYHDRITPTLETLHWLHYRVQYKVLLYVFKALKQEAPLYLEELVNIYKPARSLRSESNTKLVTPIVRTKIYIYFICILPLYNGGNHHRGNSGCVLKAMYNAI